MDPQVLAAIILASGVIVSACVLAYFAWYGVSRELRHRQRADHRRELFIAALRDCTEFLREIKEVAHALGIIAYDIAQSKQERGLGLVRRVDEAMHAFGVAGTLAPPELASLRSAAQEQVRALRMVVISGEGVREDVVRRANEKIRDLNQVIQSFSAGFEEWKAKHWDDVGARR
jgi:hypothetical protein